MRELETAMLIFLDKKLASNGAAQAAIERKDPRSLMVYAAEACVGIREEGGNNSGAMVELIQQTIGDDNKEPWCMSFVQTMIAYAEVKTGIKSPIYPSELCLEVWSKAKSAQRVKLVPLAGALAIWQHGTSYAGHVGIVIGLDPERLTFEAIEGNTESGISNGAVERDGGGVYHTVRSFKGQGKMNLIGFLKPF